MREAAARLQGWAVGGNCGRRLRRHYPGRTSWPGYHSAGKHIVEGRGWYGLKVGAVAIDQAVADAFLQAVTPAALEATLQSMRQLQANPDAALAQWRLEVERRRYQAERAPRRRRSVEPEDRLVARGLEAEWEDRLRELSAAEAELRPREQPRPTAIAKNGCAPSWKK